MFYMLLGSICAMGTGLALPIFNILFGELNDGLNGSDDITEKINRLCWIIACVAGGMVVTGTLQVNIATCYHFMILRFLRLL